MKTWQVEMIVVAAILLTVNFFAHQLYSIEILAAIAVLLSFGFAQITDRLSEQEALKEKPTVDCYRKSWYYFIGKEMFWLLYFSLNKSYSALVGVFIFLFYPFWRKFYRTKIKSL